MPSIQPFASPYTREHTVVVEGENFRFVMLLKSLTEPRRESPSPKRFDFNRVAEVLRLSPQLGRHNGCRQGARVRRTNGPDPDHIVA